MTDHHSAAAATHASSAIHIVETHEIHPHVSLNGQLMQAEQFFNKNTLDETVNINTHTNVPAGIFSQTNSFVDIFIDNDKFHILKKIYLQLDLTNNDSVNVFTGLPAQFMIFRVDYYIGDKSLGQCYDVTEYIRQLTFTPHDELYGLASTINVNPTTYSYNSSIAASGTQRYYIDITGLLENMNLFLPGLGNNKIRMTVYFQNVATWAISANPNVSANNVRVLMTHTRIPVKQYNKLMQIYKDYGIRIKYNDLRYYKYAASNTANVENTVKINVLSGLSQVMWIFDRASNPTGTACITFKALTNLYLTDGAGTNVVGGQPLNNAFLLSQAHKKFPGRFYSVQNVYPMIFCNDPVHTFQNNVITGYLPISDQHIAFWVPLATASDQIELVSLHPNSVYIRNDTIIVEKSM